MAAVVALSVLLAGCDGDASGDDASGATSTTAASSAGARTTGTTDPTIRIVLAPARLTVGGNALPFGAPDFQVSSFLERVLGDPIEEENRTCDAGELLVVEWPSLTVYVSAAGLAGWYTDDDAHATDQDVAVGASASALQAAYPTGQTIDSTLGTEFFFDAGEGKGLSALIEAGEVSTLWSGATCIAR